MKLKLTKTTCNPRFGWLASDTFRPSIPAKFLLHRLVHKFKGSMILRYLQDWRMRKEKPTRQNLQTRTIAWYMQYMQMLKYLKLTEMPANISNPWSSANTSLVPRLVHDFLLDGDSIICHRGLSLFRIHTALLSEFL